MRVFLKISPVIPWARPVGTLAHTGSGILCSFAALIYWIPDLRSERLPLSGMTNKVFRGVMKKTVLFSLAALVFLLPVAAWADVVITKPFSYETSKGLMVGVALFDVTSDQADLLIAAKAPDVSGRVELHSMVEEDGIMKMRRVEDIPLPQNTAISLGPSGYHLMLMDLKAPLKAGSTYPLTLTFTKAGEKTVIVTVKPRVVRD